MTGDLTTLDSVQIYSGDLETESSSRSQARFGLLNRESPSYTIKGSLRQ